MVCAMRSIRAFDERSDVMFPAVASVHEARPNAYSWYTILLSVRPVPALVLAHGPAVRDRLPEELLVGEPCESSRSISYASSSSRARSSTARATRAIERPDGPS